MRRVRSISTLLTLCFLATVAVVSAQQPLDDPPPFIKGPPLPMMKTVNPELAKVGQVFVITGENLGKRLAAVYLTDGKKDWKVTVVDQTETKIFAKVPDGTPNGHFRLMALTTDKPGVLVEQPVVVNVIFVPSGD